ncbi:4,5-dihydroxyphthalate decarboxylase [Stereum hirsutum FP-91666 SS1]|uniref:4,5-dihydroxyphthalate decarboxylase n=1 Tax=Stereum hirsutum (strain FP-91666) TaxID=721885 RepID=UPI000440F331|nr:4,5-dihydroxyphthalate decarboxylase [Stereum hirsutum FP-91666 SS1]EIM88379.1 4,5-dihydroxyphthalate decarboxylase [Stereum hirsutum FP-91666 SS1]
MAPLRLSLACWDYDRVKALEDGRIKAEGIELNFLNLRVEETFFRQLRFEEFDVSEMSLSSYVLTLEKPDPPFIALPVFPSRFFRHQSIYVNLRAGIKHPSELAGRRVGVPEFQMTAPVWERGILEDEYGLKYDAPEYYTGNVEPSTQERKEKVPLKLADSVKIQSIAKGKCLAQMLADGEIDALECATAPSTFGTHPDVGRLFPNAKEVEQEYFKRTGLFPIMHIIVVKRSIIKAHPWVARTLTKAFASSLDYAYTAIHERAALRYILPWLEFHVEETKAALCRDGENRWWQDGLTDQNRRTLDKFLEYSHNQGLSKRRWEVEDIFAKSSLEAFVV